MPTFSGWITACVTHYHCQRYIRRAVESLLAQSYPWVRVVVVNDGDSRLPWTELGSIQDRRVIRFDLPVNKGAYFSYELVRQATPDSYFLLQDADDWASPDRVSVLLESLQENGADLAVSAQPQFSERSDGTPYFVGSRWNKWSERTTREPFVVQNSLDAHYQYRVPHHGLFRTAALADIGGYYGGFRVGWDTLMTNLILMVGSVSWTPQNLYYRLVRQSSLTHSIETGVESSYARQVSRCLAYLYEQCYAAYLRRQCGQISRAALSRAIQSIIGMYVSAEERALLGSLSRQLRGSFQ